jgi:hypothetical protein
MTKINYAIKYQNWQPKYNWDTCKTNRKEYGKFLCSFLTNTKDGLVVNMNGAWGTGKTELLRRLYVELAEQKHPVVYIDAWESDFSKDALSVVSSEFLNQLEHIFTCTQGGTKSELLTDAKNKIDELKLSFGTCMKLAKAVSVLTGNPEIAPFISAAEKIESVLPNKSKSSNAENIKLVDRVGKTHHARIQAMKDIKEKISFLADLMEQIYDLKMPVIVLIDELDRCRPTYAIEMIEVIKHFFETKGCVFLVATDTEALQSSVKAVYGHEFKAEAYLRRFFDRKITLPEISPLDYLNTKKLDFNKYLDQGILLYPFLHDQSYNTKLMAELFFKNGFELRDIEQALQKFFASLDYVAIYKSEEEIVINSVVLITGIVENQLNNEHFKQRENNNYVEHSRSDYGPIIKELRAHELINIQLQLVTKTISNEVYSGNSMKRGALKECLKIQSYNHEESWYKHNAKTFNLNQIVAEQINDFERSDIRYWLWEDYKNIIELSGHIE